jgi:hypothetical protein
MVQNGLKDCFAYFELRFRARLPRALAVDFAFNQNFRLSDAALAAQVRPDLAVEVLPWVTGSHRNPNLAQRHPDLCADL